jgi:hypothetical protein
MVADYLAAGGQIHKAPTGLTRDHREPGASSVVAGTLHETQASRWANKSTCINTAAGGSRIIPPARRASGAGASQGRAGEEATAND